MDTRTTDFGGRRQAQILPDQPKVGANSAVITLGRRIVSPWASKTAVALAVSEITASTGHEPACAAL